MKPKSSTGPLRTSRRCRLVFTEGDYHHALRCHFDARDWLLFNGLCFRDGFGGIIHSPRFKDQDCPGSVVPAEWADAKTGWRTTVTLEFAETSEIPDPVAWLKTLELPESAKLEFDDE